MLFHSKQRISLQVTYEKAMKVISIRRTEQAGTNHLAGRRCAPERTPQYLSTSKDAADWESFPLSTDANSHFAFVRRFREVCRQNF